MNNEPIFSVLTGKGRACSDEIGCPYCMIQSSEVEWFADYPCPPGYTNTGADFSREDGKYFACTPETYSYVLLTEEEANSSYCYGLGGTNIRTGCCNGTCPSAPC